MPLMLELQATVRGWMWVQRIKLRSPGLAESVLSLSPLSSPNTPSFFFVCAHAYVCVYGCVYLCVQVRVQRPGVGTGYLP